MEPGAKMNIEIKIPYGYPPFNSPPQVEYSVQAPGQQAIQGSAPATVRHDSSLVDSGSNYISHEPGYTVEVSPSSSHSTVRKETRRYVTTTPGETVTRRYVTSQPTETVTRRHHVITQPAETVTRRYVTTTPTETVTRRYVTSGPEPESITRRNWVTSSQPQETIITGGNIHVTPAASTQQPVNQYTKTTTTTVTTRDVDSSETSSLHNAASSPPSSTVISSNPPSANRQSSRVEVDEHRFQVTLDVSQYKPEDIEVKVDDNKLTVRAEAKGSNPNTGYVEKEFFRQYTLPDDVDSSQVRCYFAEDGNLTLEAPRVPRQQPSFVSEPPRFTAMPNRSNITPGTYTYHSGPDPSSGSGERMIPIHMRVGTTQSGGKTVPIVEEVFSDIESNRSFRK